MVIAIIAILATMLLTAVNRGKAKGKQSSCLNNKRQLGLAWWMYAEDNRDIVVPNWDGAADGGNDQKITAWVTGRMVWDLTPDSTNTALLTDPVKAPLALYLARSAKVFKCPADTFLTEIQRRAGWHERVRSVSMNQFIGRLQHGCYWNLNVIQKTSPSKVWTIIDEHPDTISFASFRWNAGGTWSSIPGSLHGGAGTLVFADGHAETKKWLSPDTLVSVSYGLNDPPRSGDGRDFIWLWGLDPRAPF